MRTLGERLRRREDRDAIHQLLVDYGRYLDAGDVESYLRNSLGWKALS